MADKTVTEKDVEDTLRELGIVEAKTASRPAPPTSDDIDETLRQAGIFPESPAERAALRQRSAVKRTTPAAGPGFPDPEASPEAKALAEKRGYTGYAASSMPVTGPVLNRAAAAGNAAIDREPEGSTFGERYDRNVETVNQADKYFAKQHPVGAPIAGLVGGVAGMGPFGMSRLGQLALGMRGPSVGSRIVTGTLGGAGIGGTDAALRGEDPMAGMAVGGIGGAAGPMIGEGARGATNLVSQYLWPRVGALKGMNNAAVNKLTGALEGETPASLAAGRDRMGPAGFLGDVNTGMGDVVGGLAAMPGEHKAVVREAYRLRDAGQRARVNDALDTHIGPKVNLPQLEKYTIEARKKAADPLYEQFRSTVIPPTDELNALVPRLKEAGAFDMANKLAGITGDKLNLKFLGPDGSKISSPTAQTWDYVKRGLDAKIEDAYGGGNKAMGNALRDLKHDLIKQVEAAPGGEVYAKARKAFASHSEILDQVSAGKDTFLGGRAGMTADELAEDIKGLKGPLLAARVVGLRAAADDAMRATMNGDTTLRNKLLAPENQDKIRLLIGDDKGKALIKTLQQEKYLRDNGQTLIHGTQTTPKAEQVKNLEQKSLPQWDPNVTSLTSWIPPRMRDAIRPTSIIDAWRGQNHVASMNQLAQAVTTPEGPQLNDLLAALASEARRQNKVSSVAARSGNLLTGAITGPTTTTARRRHADK